MEMWSLVILLEDFFLASCKSTYSNPEFIMDILFFWSRTSEIRSLEL